MGSCKGAGELPRGLMFWAAKATHKHGNPASIASFAGSASPSSSTSGPLVVSDLGIRLPRALAKEDDEHAVRFQLFDHLVFGLAPSREEASEAVSSIMQTFNPNPHVQTQQQWLSEGHVTQSRVLDALRLLRTSPSVERTVVSLASDSAVWDAMMRNESVRELRASFSSEEGIRGSGLDEVKGTSFHELLAQALNWVFEITKPKIMEFALKIVKILEELLSGALKGKDTGHQLGLLEDALRSSFMLSFLVSIVVVVARMHKVLGPLVA